MRASVQLSSSGGAVAESENSKKNNTLGWLKSSFRFSTKPYRKTQMKFMANAISLDDWVNQCW